MKNKIILVLAFFIVSTVACKKQLNTIPEGAISDLNTFSAVKIAVIGCYQGFKSDSYYNSPSASGEANGWSALPDLMGDDFVETTTSFGNWKTSSEMSYNEDYGIAKALYQQPYEIISRANNVLNALGTYENNPVYSDEAKIIKAQMLAIRAHAHFDLMRYFATEFGRNSNTLGVPYVTLFDPQKPLSSLPSRNTVKENYDKIFDDLNTAILLFKESGNTKNNASRNFIDITVVYAMRARVNYYASNWENALADAEVIIASKPLSNAIEYVKMYTKGGEAAPPSEVLWAIPSDNALMPGGATNGESANYRIASPLSDIITGLGGVYVKPEIITFFKDNSDFERRVLLKYDDVRSFKVFRTGEMALIKAEAQQKLGDNALALTTLNDLRTKRGVATGTETGTDLLNAITLLRRVELLGEGHRWFDIKRTTKTINRTECGAAGNSSSNTCSVAASSNNWAFPIPFNEIKANPNLVQNPGY
jgi:starch-binding outer membrane protein, SusD/RagB family